MWACLELLWQRKVGTHSRAKERAEEMEAARQSAAYERSKRRLPGYDEFHKE